MKDGELLHVAQNDQVTHGDPLGHAEVVLVREVLAARGREALRGSTVYASGEPCAMCSGAMFWVGVKRLVFAADQLEIIRSLGGAELPIRSAQVLAGAKPSILIDGPVLGPEAFAILQRFKS